MSEHGVGPAQLIATLRKGREALSGALEVLEGEGSGMTTIHRLLECARDLADLAQALVLHMRDNDADEAALRTPTTVQPSSGQPRIALRWCSAWMRYEAKDAQRSTMALSQNLTEMLDALRRASQNLNDSPYPFLDAEPPTSRRLDGCGNWQDATRRARGSCRRSCRGKPRTTRCWPSCGVNSRGTWPISR